MSFICWIAFLARFFFSRRATQISLVGYATAVWLFAYYPWNVLLLALVAARVSKARY